MIENADADPIVVKNLTRSLRELPLVEPPGDLRGRILGSLPRHRGFWGRLEYALKRDLFPHSPSQRPSFFLPATPSEYGMALLSAGVFFLFLLIALVAGMYRAKAAFGLAEPGSSVLAPLLSMVLPVVLLALTGTILLLSAGWTQLRSPHVIIPCRLRLGVVGILFGTAAGQGALGALASWTGGQPMPDLVALWLGVSGLIVTLGLVLAGSREALGSAIGQLFTNPRHYHSRAGGKPVRQPSTLLFLIP